MGPAYLGVIRALTVSGNIQRSFFMEITGRSFQAGRGKPFVYMSGGLSLAGLSEKVVSFLTRRFGVRFLSKSLGFLRQPIRKRQCVLETASLHGAAPFRVKGHGLSLRSPKVKSCSKLNRRGIAIALAGTV
jgi:hypothetical protein